MRVAIATINPPSVTGGMERQVSRLLQALEARGHSWEVLSTADVEVGKSPLDLIGTRLLRQSAAMAQRLRRRASEFDVLLCNNMVGPSSWPGGRRLCWFHICLREYAVAVGERMLPQYRWVTYHLLGGSERAACRSGISVAVSDEVARELRTHYRARNVRVIRNGVDLKHFTPGPRDDAYLESLGAPRDRPVLLYVGRWEKAKAVDVLLEVADRLRDEACLVAAVGGTAAQVPKHPAFVVAGDVKWEDLPRLYRSADCLLFPSCYEGFGLAIAEAAACGLPVVTRNVGCAADLIDGGAAYREAVLPRQAGPEEFAGAVRKVLADGPLRAELSRVGIETARRLFDEERSLGELVELLEQQAGSGGAPRSSEARSSESRPHP